MKAEEIFDKELRPVLNAVGEDWTHTAHIALAVQKQPAEAEPFLLELDLAELVEHDGTFGRWRRASAQTPSST